MKNGKPSGKPYPLNCRIMELVAASVLEKAILLEGEFWQDEFKLKDISKPHRSRLREVMDALVAMDCLRETGKFKKSRRRTERGLYLKCYTVTDRRNCLRLLKRIDKPLTRCEQLNLL